MANVTVSIVINVLSARGSMILPTKVFMLYRLAIHPSNCSGNHASGQWSTKMYGHPPN
jgi:hypothetical protein